MSYRDFETKKSLHINLTSDTHAALKIRAFKHKLSMQEIFEELARQIVCNEPYMQKVISGLESKKRARATQKMIKTDAESIFRVIEAESPIDD
tara:strand:- start:3359 stop:3637 length:279 start_codon:yes stop_codon:yes gene_type:complete